MEFPENIKGFDNDEAARRSFRLLINAMSRGDEKALWSLRDELKSWPQPQTNDDVEYVLATAFKEGTKYLNVNGELRPPTELEDYKASVSGGRNGYRFFFLRYEGKVLVVAIAVDQILLLMEKPEEVSAALTAAKRTADVVAFGKGS